jgi:chromosome segregation protein
MVHIKRVELTNFKSFGNTTGIPLLPGFTVISGPNGSGKSNILDALLFCLGLASSRGMRAERLPDLVNNSHNHRGTVEASVTVTFDLSDAPGTLEEEQVSGGAGDQGSEGAGEQSDPPLPPLAKGGVQNPKSTDWSITRRLRVTQQGSYTSNYYINGESCTLTELHAQLERLRIYPEGYNVVLQGDVTSIITMNARERREIIDELAGVAAFDRKIAQAKETLNTVKEQEDRYRIVEAELIAQRDRLSADRIKAEKYQKLRAELQDKELWELVLGVRQLTHQVWNLREQIAAGDRQNTDLTTQLTNLTAEITSKTVELDQLNARVKALGEEELLALQSTLATQEAEQRQLQRQQRELDLSIVALENNIKQNQLESQQQEQTLKQLIIEKETVENQLAGLISWRDEARRELVGSREQADAIAAASEAWVQQQTALNRQIETLLQTIEPQRTEQAQLRERFANLSRQIEEHNQLLQSLEPQIASKQSLAVDFELLLQESEQTIQSLSQALAAAEQDLQIQQDTQKRLLQEQRDKQRQLDKLEAQTQAQQEASGTYAAQVIFQSGLKGICGLVAQLGKVEPRYQLALEIAAGARLGNLVVEDDSIAAKGIEILKQKRAGRITFLPLNKIRAGQLSTTVALRYANGYIDYAVNLIECEPRYREIFAYVFGNTVVFDNLNSARQHLGQYRIVTLEGELLESSGAMTGGSVNQRSGLRFGISDPAESAEAEALKKRLEEIEIILERCGEMIQSLTVKTKHLSQEVNEAKTKRREQQLHFEQLRKEIQSLISQQSGTQNLLAKNTLEFALAESRLQILDSELPAQETQLAQVRQSLAELEQSQTPSEWQQIQVMIKEREAVLNQREQTLRNAEGRIRDLASQQQRLQEKIQECNQRLQEYQQQQIGVNNQLSSVMLALSTIGEQIGQTKVALTEVEQKLGEEKVLRDRTENELRSHHLAKQQLEWELQKLQETQTTRREELATLQPQLQEKQAELPDPLPSVPEQVKLDELHQEIKTLQKRLHAMEPVNMLALEEYERTQKRLEELSQKLSTLEAERTELLLRIENFTTLRLRAFTEAFDAVNQNFQTIFLEFSEGDGFLQLDNPQDPFAGGLNLVAHPKGKPVQRLSSMSGGEKSMTALSFIFALQRYRPSPFYAFDEVDMFLDGANVERLARMIAQQSHQAQFIVVSHKGPMIKSAERVIGVTQARGAYTQVVGIKLQSPNS